MKIRLQQILTILFIALLVAALILENAKILQLEDKIATLNQQLASISQTVYAHSDDLEDMEATIEIENKKFIRLRNDDGTTSITCDIEDLSEQYTFYQLRMTGNAGGFCYAIQKPDGALVMIDSGYEGESAYVRDFILDHGGIVDSWFLTHPHIDHIGGIINILSHDHYDGIQISNIYYNPFTSDYFEKEEEGKDLTFVNYAVMYQEFNEVMERCTDIKFIPVTKKDQIVIDQLKIDCLSSFDPTVFDTNANSLVLHLDICGVTFLITADITDQTLTRMRETYGDTNSYFNVDFLQIPHHGYVAGISNDVLFQLTMPSYTLLDCSSEEYNTNAVNILTLTEWVEKLEIPVLKRFEGPNTITIK
ncbi:MAG: MBL fold metallo-hydrolase [Clostridia bacterium]|nr:MBL fold metallo-hydrolase [Clostridia bacterium]